MKGEMLAVFVVWLLDNLALAKSFLDCYFPLGKFSLDFSVILILQIGRQV